MGATRPYLWLEVVTVDGKTFYWNLDDTSEGDPLVDQFARLMDLRASQGEMIGTASELEKLSELVVKGVLDQTDFNRAKGMMIGKPMSQVEESILMLESISRLHKQGVLTESEFNIKKWDILSK